ncbi:transposase family protein [Actinophytocola sp. NPDC049390]|uniref:transposase family protein n=1 Tax=Actinophytocola sp. NPDC049390 TaxID=3363894 RepID=UPI00379AD422
MVLTLVLLRSNAAQTMLADLFGVSQPTVSRVFRAMLPLVEQVTCLHRPPLPEVLRGRVVLVDGTMVPVGNRRTDRVTHDANYSGKRHEAGLSVQVLCDLDGQLLAVADPMPGKTHDRAGFAAAGFDQLLATTPTIGDLGYQGTQVIRPRRKHPGHKEHDPATVIWNRSVASVRIAVERCIAHWKNWKILATGYRGRLTELPNLIRIITTLEYYRLGW